MNNPLTIIPLLLRWRRPSHSNDMKAVSCPFWLKKGYEALTFFGTIITHSEAEAERMNRHFDALKNHELIHLYQAKSTHNSWLCFYTLYGWYWMKAWRYRKRIPNAGYRLNPFEIEAYKNMYDLNYLERNPKGASQWRQYAKMTLEERMKIV